MFEHLNTMVKNGIRMIYDSADTNCPLGTSKIGGTPDILEMFDWPHFYGESYRGEVNNFPLTFLCQINLSEIKGFDFDNLLPEKGILYFFYELETMNWGMNLNEKNCFRIYYLSDLKNIKKIDFHPKLLDENKIPEMKLNFYPENELPCFEEFIETNKCDFSLVDEYDDYKKTICEDFEEENINKILGYADVIQNGMLGCCAEIDHSNLDDWTLLLQLDCIQTENYQMLFGDMGRLYFYIKKEDLKNLNFKNCWIQLQCG